MLVQGVRPASLFPCLCLALGPFRGGLGSTAGRPGRFGAPGGTILGAGTSRRLRPGTLSSLVPHSLPLCHAHDAMASKQCACPSHQVYGPCCGEFLATKEAIRSLPKALYVDCLAWIRKTAMPEDKFGRVFEYLWHVFFSRGHQHKFQMDPAQCEAYLYGEQHGGAAAARAAGGGGGGSGVHWAAGREARAAGAG